MWSPKCLIRNVPGWLLRHPRSPTQAYDLFFGVYITDRIVHLLFWRTWLDSNQRTSFIRSASQQEAGLSHLSHTSILILPSRRGRKTRGQNREVKKQAKGLDVKNSSLIEFFVSILFKNIEKGSAFPQPHTALKMGGLTTALIWEVSLSGSYGCERVDSNHRFSAYEADEIAASLLRNGASNWIRTNGLPGMNGLLYR